jgi:hypothetical protein
MYYLDFVTIIQLLREFQRSGMLQTALPKGVGNTQEACWIQLKLLRGEIIDCQIITDSGGTIVADKNVLRQVEGLGPLEWTFGPLKESYTAPMKALDKSLPPTTLSVPASPTSSLPVFSSSQPYAFIVRFVPHRLTSVELSSLVGLTRQQRRILALVDGKRDISQIVALLFSSSNMESGVQEVFVLLKELERLKIIALR